MTCLPCIEHAMFVASFADRETWRRPKLSGLTPAARENHSCTTVVNKLFIFGGRNSTETLGDLCILDAGRKTWLLFQPGTKLRACALPGLRMCRSCSEGKSRFLVFVLKGNLSCCIIERKVGAPNPA
jgi:hypothetical protein